MALANKSMRKSTPPCEQEVQLAKIDAEAVEALIGALRQLLKDGKFTEGILKERN
jgi:hypothetical protein